MLRDAATDAGRDPLPRIRRRIPAAAVTALCGVAVAAGHHQPAGPLGRIALVCFAIVAPLVAIARMMSTAGVALALAVGAAGSVAVNTLVVQVMLSTDTWSPRTGVVAVGLIAALLWLVPPGRPAHRNKEGAP